MKTMKDNKRTIINFRQSILCKAAACLLIFTFTVTNVTYGYDKSTFDRIRASESESLKEKVEDRLSKGRPSVLQFERARSKAASIPRRMAAMTPNESEEPSFDITDPDNYTPHSVKKLATNGRFGTLDRSFSTFDVDCLAPYRKLGWVIERRIKTRKIKTTIYEDKRDHCLFFAYNTEIFSGARIFGKLNLGVEIEVYLKAQEVGFDNIPEIRVLKDRTVLTRIADTYDDDEIAIERHTQLEDLLLLLLFFDDTDHYKWGNLFTDVYARKIDKTPHYLCYDLGNAKRPKGLTAALGGKVRRTYVTNLDLVKRTRTGEFDWRYAHRRIDDLLKAAKSDDVRDSLNILRHEITEIKKIVCSHLGTDTTTPTTETDDQRGGTKGDPPTRSSPAENETPPVRRKAASTPRRMAAMTPHESKEASFDITDPANYTPHSVEEQVDDYNFNTFDLDCLAPYRKRGWVIERDIPISRIKPYIYEDKDRCLFFAYQTAEFPAKLIFGKNDLDVELKVYKKALEVGFDNIPEIRVLKDGTVLTRIADTYTDDEITLERHAQLEDVLLLSVFFDDTEHLVSQLPHGSRRTTETILIGLHLREIEEMPYYLVYDLSNSASPEGLKAALVRSTRNAYVARLDLVEKTRAGEFDWGYAYRRIEDLLKAAKRDDIRSSLEILRREIIEIEKIVRARLGPSDTKGNPPARSSPAESEKEPPTRNLFVKGEAISLEVESVREEKIVAKRDYTLLKLAGSGFGADVWKAQDNETGEIVALRIYNPSGLGGVLKRTVRNIAHFIAYQSPFPYKCIRSSLLANALCGDILADIVENASDDLRVVRTKGIFFSKEYRSYGEVVDWIESDKDDDSINKEEALEKFRKFAEEAGFAHRYQVYDKLLAPAHTSLNIIKDKESGRYCWVDRMPGIPLMVLFYPFHFVAVLRNLSIKTFDQVDIEKAGQYIEKNMDRGKADSMLARLVYYEELRREYDASRLDAIGRLQREVKEWRIKERDISYWLKSEDISDDAAEFLNKYRIIYFIFAILGFIPIAGRLSRKLLLNANTWRHLGRLCWPVIRNTYRSRHWRDFRERTIKKLTGLMLSYVEELHEKGKISPLELDRFRAAAKGKSWFTYMEVLCWHVLGKFPLDAIQAALGALALWDIGEMIFVTGSFYLSTPIILGIAGVLIGGLYRGIVTLVFKFTHRDVEFKWRWVLLSFSPGLLGYLAMLLQGLDKVLVLKMAWYKIREAVKNVLEIVPGYRELRYYGAKKRYRQSSPRRSIVEPDDKAESKPPARSSPAEEKAQDDPKTRPYRPAERISAIPPGSKRIERDGRVLYISPEAAKKMEELDDFIRATEGKVEISGRGLTKPYDDKTTVLIDFLLPRRDNILILDRPIETGIAYQKYWLKIEMALVDLLADSKHLRLTCVANEICIESGSGGSPLNIERMVADLDDDQKRAQAWDAINAFLSGLSMSRWQLPRDMAALRSRLKDSGGLSLNTNLDYVATPTGGIETVRYRSRLYAEVERQGAVPHHQMHHHPITSVPHLGGIKRAAGPSCSDFYFFKETGIEWFEIRVLDAKKEPTPGEYAASGIYNMQEVYALEPAIKETLENIERLDPGVDPAGLHRHVQKLIRLFVRLRELRYRTAEVVKFALRAELFDEHITRLAGVENVGSIKDMVLWGIFGSADPADYLNGVSIETLRMHVELGTHAAYQKVVTAAKTDPVLRQELSMLGREDILPVCLLSIATNTDIIRRGHEKIKNLTRSSPAELRFEEEGFAKAGQVTAEEVWHVEGGMQRWIESNLPKVYEGIEQLPISAAAKELLRKEVEATMEEQFLSKLERLKPLTKSYAWHVLFILILNPAYKQAVEMVKEEYVTDYGKILETNPHYDPFYHVKNRANEEELTGLRANIDEVFDADEERASLERAISISTLGNARDQFRGSLTEEAETRLFHLVDNRGEILERLIGAKKIAYCTDNAGEIYADLLLIHLLLVMGKEVTIFSRNEPYATNDVISPEIESLVEAYSGEFATTTHSQKRKNLNEFLKDGSLKVETDEFPASGLGFSSEKGQAFGRRLKQEGHEIAVIKGEAWIETYMDARSTSWQSKIQNPWPIDTISLHMLKNRDLLFDSPKEPDMEKVNTIMRYIPARTSAAVIQSGIYAEVREKAKFVIQPQEVIQILREVCNEEGVDFEDVRVKIDRFPVKWPFEDGVNVVEYYNATKHELIKRSHERAALDVAINTRAFESTGISSLKEAIRNGVRDHQEAPRASAQTVHGYTTKSDRKERSLEFIHAEDKNPCWGDLSETAIWEMNYLHWKHGVEDRFLDDLQASNNEEFVEKQVTDFIEELRQRIKTNILRAKDDIVVAEFAAGSCKHADIWMRKFYEKAPDLFGRLVFIIADVSEEGIHKQIASGETPFLASNMKKIRIAEVDLNEFKRVYMYKFIDYVEHMEEGHLNYLARHSRFLSKERWREELSKSGSMYNLLMDIRANLDDYGLDKEAQEFVDKQLKLYYAGIGRDFAVSLGIVDQEILDRLQRLSLVMINYAYNLMPLSLVSRRSGVMYNREARAYLAPEIDQDFIDKHREEFDKVQVTCVRSLIGFIQNRGRYEEALRRRVLSPELIKEIWRGIRLEYRCVLPWDVSPYLKMEKLLVTNELDNVTLPVNWTFNSSVTAIILIWLYQRRGVIEILDTVLGDLTELISRYWGLGKYGISPASWYDYQFVAETILRNKHYRSGNTRWRVAVEATPVKDIVTSKSQNRGTFLRMGWESDDKVEEAQAAARSSASSLDPAEYVPDWFERILSQFPPDEALEMGSVFMETAAETAAEVKRISEDPTYYRERFDSILKRIGKKPPILLITGEHPLEFGSVFIAERVNAVLQAIGFSTIERHLPIETSAFDLFIHKYDELVERGDVKITHDELWAEMHAIAKLQAEYPETHFISFHNASRDMLRKFMEVLTEVERRVYDQGAAVFPKSIIKNVCASETLAICRDMPKSYLRKINALRRRLGKTWVPRNFQDEIFVDLKETKAQGLMSEEIVLRCVEGILNSMIQTTQPPSADSPARTSAAVTKAVLDSRKTAQELIDVIEAQVAAGLSREDMVLAARNTLSRSVPSAEINELNKARLAEFNYLLLTEVERAAEEKRIMPLLQSLYQRGGYVMFSNVDLSSRTTIKIGHKASALVSPRNLNELREIVRFCNENTIWFYTLGEGSNILIKRDVVGLVISLKKLTTHSVDVKSRIIEAEAGVLLKHLSTIAASKSLTGLEFGCGIPGNLGGAIATAASYPSKYYEKWLRAAFIPAINPGIEGAVEEVTVILPDGSLRVLTKEQLGFGFRRSIFKTNKRLVVYKAKLKLHYRDRVQILKTIRILQDVRRRARGTADDIGILPRSLGSTFCNEDLSYVYEDRLCTASELIEIAGADTMSIGGIRQSRPGVLFNDGTGTSEEYTRLTDAIKSAVHERCGVELIEEVHFIGYVGVDERPSRRRKGGPPGRTSPAEIGLVESLIEGDAHHQILLDRPLEEAVEEEGMLPQELLSKPGEHIAMPPELQVELADASDKAFSKLMERFRATLNDKSLRDNADLSEVLEAARAINPDIKIDLSREEIRSANFITTLAVGDALNKQVFMPAERILVLNFIGTDVYDLRWIVGQDYFNVETWLKELYLGKPIWVANIKYSQMSFSDDIGRTICEYAFIDDSDAEEQLLRNYDFLTKYCQQYAKWLEEKGIDFEALRGKIRSYLDRYHEKRHAEDSVFASLRSRNSSSLGPSEIDTAISILKDTSALKHQIVSAHYELTKWQHAVIASEVSADLGGLIELMEYFINEGDPDSAYAVFLLRVFGSWELQYGAPPHAEANKYMLRNRDMTALAELLWKESGHPALPALELLKKMYAADFYTDQERAELLAKPRLKPVIPSEFIGDGAHARMLRLSKEAGLGNLATALTRLCDEGMLQRFKPNEDEWVVWDRDGKPHDINGHAADPRITVRYGLDPVKEAALWGHELLDWFGAIDEDGSIVEKDKHLGPAFEVALMEALNANNHEPLLRFKEHLQGLDVDTRLKDQPNLLEVASKAEVPKKPRKRHYTSVDAPSPAEKKVRKFIKNAKIEIHRLERLFDRIASIAQERTAANDPHVHAEELESTLKRCFTLMNSSTYAPMALLFGPLESLKRIIKLCEPHLEEMNLSINAMQQIEGKRESRCDPASLVSSLYVEHNNIKQIVDRFEEIVDREFLADFDAELSEAEIKKRPVERYIWGSETIFVPEEGNRELFVFLRDHGYRAPAKNAFTELGGISVIVMKYRPEDAAPGDSTARSSAAESEIATTDLLENWVKDDIDMLLELIEGRYINPEFFDGIHLHVQVDKDKMPQDSEAYEIASLWLDIVEKRSKGLVTGTIVPNRNEENGLIKMTASRRGKRGSDIGHCSVDIRGSIDTMPRLVGLLNIAFAGSIIPEDDAEYEDNQADYRALIDYIDRYHFLLTGRSYFTIDEFSKFEDGTIEEMTEIVEKRLRKIFINLPPARRIEYDKSITIETLRAV
ncbi:ARMT1-like domain-containing protein [Omnitrophica bacterium]|nr:ARMT1-like domain-containing protein [Candidatus Omnitrophota bacterium]